MQVSRKAPFENSPGIGNDIVYASKIHTIGVYTGMDIHESIQAILADNIWRKCGQFFSNYEYDKVAIKFDADQSL